MRRLLILLVTAVVLDFALGSVRAVAARDQQMHDLAKRHKQERKTLKQQEHAMKNVMNGHELTGTERQRFKRNLKMQRQVLQRGQKDETKTLKETRKFEKQTKRAHATS